MNKPICIMMVGLPASGKSFYSNLLSKEYNAIIHSSDMLRKELYNNIDDQNNNRKLFQELHKRIKLDLLNNMNIIYDATNISHKRRRVFVENLNKIDCQKVCILVATPYDDCIRQNKDRSRFVPIDIITKMYKNIWIPQKYEGWDDIRIIWNYVAEKFCVHNLFNGKNGLNNIGQDNPHHTLTIGKHCLRCMSELEILDNNRCTELYEAALLHDIGKRFTKNFKNAKGENTSSAHYYNHHLVSAYDSLFYTKEYSDEKRLKIANYIQWHMQPFFIKTEKQRDKYRNLWGNKFYSDIMLLHKADKKAK